MGLLKIAGADFSRRDLRGDRQHRHTRPGAIEEPIDQMQIARAATAGTNRELARQVRLGAGSKGGDLLVPDMQPLDFALAPDRIGNTVEAVADDAVNPLDAGSRESLGEL